MAAVAVRCLRSTSLARKHLSCVPVETLRSSIANRPVSQASMLVASNAVDRRSPTTLPFDGSWTEIARELARAGDSRELLGGSKLHAEVAKEMIASPSIVEDPQGLLRGFVAMNRNARRPKKANHGKRPCSHVRRRARRRRKVTGGQA